MPKKGHRSASASARSKYQRKYNSTPEQVKKRSNRNKARRKLSCGSKDVHHKDGNPLNNKKSNLSCSSVKSNRSKNRKKKK